MDFSANDLPLSLEEEEKWWNLRKKISLKLGISVDTPVATMDELKLVNKNQWRLTLVAYFKDEKEIDEQDISLSFEEQWRHNNFVTKWVRGKFVKVTFLEASVAARVLYGGHWLYKGKIVAFERWPLFSPLESLAFDTTPIWVQFFSMPTEKVCLDNLKTLANKIGKVLIAEEKERKYLGDTFMRAKILVKFRKPLIPSIMMEMDENSSTKVLLKYEDIPSYCYVCAIIGHTEENCKLKSSMIRAYKIDSPTGPIPSFEFFRFFKTPLSIDTNCAWEESLKYVDDGEGGFVIKSLGGWRMHVPLVDESTYDSDNEEDEMESCGDIIQGNKVGEEEEGGMEENTISDEMLCKKGQEFSIKVNDEKAGEVLGKWENGDEQLKKESLRVLFS